MLAGSGIAKMRIDFFSWAHLVFSKFVCCLCSLSLSLSSFYVPMLFGGNWVSTLLSLILGVLLFFFSFSFPFPPFFSSSFFRVLGLYF